MKKIAMLTVLMFFTTSIFTGCGAKIVDPNYMAYTQTLQAQFVANKEPLVSIEVDIDGKIAGIIVNQPVKQLNVEQKKSHPVWAVASNIVKVFGIVGGIWATGDAISSIVDASSGNTTYTNSGNDNSGNSGDVGIEHINTDTVTTTDTVDG